MLWTVFFLPERKSLQNWTKGKMVAETFIIKEKLSAVHRNKKMSRSHLKNQWNVPHQRLKGVKLWIFHLSKESVGCLLTQSCLGRVYSVCMRERQREVMWTAPSKARGLGLPQLLEFPILPPALGATCAATGFNLCLTGFLFCLISFYPLIPPISNENLYAVSLYVGKV